MCVGRFRHIAIHFVGQLTRITSGAISFPRNLDGRPFSIARICSNDCDGCYVPACSRCFLTPIWNQSFGFVQFYVTVVGIIFLSIMLGINPSLAIYGGILTVIGILMFTFQMLKTLAKRKENTAMSHLVLAAILCFLLTILAGLSLT